jgi:hypothetical protein
LENLTERSGKEKWGENEEDEAGRSVAGKWGKDD